MTAACHFKSSSCYFAFYPARLWTRLCSSITESHFKYWHIEKFLPQSLWLSGVTGAGFKWCHQRWSGTSGLQRAARTAAGYLNPESACKRVHTHTHTHTHSWVIMLLVRMYFMPPSLLPHTFTFCLCVFVFVEVLCEVQSRIRSGFSPRHHQLPCVPLRRKHLHWQRLQEEVSAQSPSWLIKAEIHWIIYLLLFWCSFFQMCKKRVKRAAGITHFCWST